MKYNTIKVVTMFSSFYSQTHWRHRGRDRMVLDLQLLVQLLPIVPLKL
jgi:hypothetical protein